MAENQSPEEITLCFINTLEPDVKSDEIEELRKNRPYRCILKIVLSMWSVAKQRRAAKDLQLLRLQPDTARVSNYAVLVMWNDLNLKPYYAYVMRHKSYVEQCYRLFNDTITSQVKPILMAEGLLPLECEPDSDPTEEQIRRHDDSKFQLTEALTYAQRWFPNSCLGEPDEDAWQTGLEHHYQGNEHHPQHWGCRPMPWRYLVEAVYDMGAMELEKQFGGAEPDDRTKLLLFQEVHLERFRHTGQYALLKRLLSCTIDQYCPNA